MIRGNVEYDFKDLETVTQYINYRPTDKPVALFWKVFHALPSCQKRRVLVFATGSDRIPIKGLKAMRFVIQKSGTDEHHFPAAHTCFNMIDLPPYQNEETLKSKLLYALDNAQTFTLQ